MKTIETTLTVTPEGTATLQLAGAVPPGQHKAVVVEEAPLGPQEPLEFTSYDVELVDPNFTFRREDLYGDDGR